MPTNKARKAAARAAQRPGETYTAALRRLTADQPTGTDPVRWELAGAGLGSTEYTALLDGREITVCFVGDHRAPWPGYWDALDADNQVIADGRYRFPTTPTDADVDAALARIAGQLRALHAGADPDTIGFYDPSHGDPLTPADLDPDTADRDGDESDETGAGDGVGADRLVCLTWGTDDWGVTELTPDGHDGTRFRPLHVRLPGGHVTWRNGAWQLHDGSPAGVHAL